MSTDVFCLEICLGVTTHMFRTLQMAKLFTFTTRRPSPPYATTITYTNRIQVLLLLLTTHTLLYIHHHYLQTTVHIFFHCLLCVHPPSLSPSCHCTLISALAITSTAGCQQRYRLPQLTSNWLTIYSRLDRLRSFRGGSVRLYRNSGLR